MEKTRLFYCGEGELKKAHETDIGFDVSPISLKIIFDTGGPLRAAETVTKENFNESYIRGLLDMYAHRVLKLHFDTGIAVEPKGNFWIMACANSRVCKTNFVLNNGVGIIDPSYRGTIRFIYANTMPLGYNCVEDILMFCKTCGQLIPIAYCDIATQKVESLSETERGTGGFGSTAN